MTKPVPQIAPHSSTAPRFTCVTSLRQQASLSHHRSHDLRIWPLPSRPPPAMSPGRCARSTSTTSKDTASRAKRGGEPSPFGPWKTSTGRGPASGPRPARAVCLLGLVEDTFDLEGDRDLLADDDAATGDRAVVADTEVVPVDLAAGRE